MNWDFFQRKIAFALEEDWPLLSAECERVGMTNYERFVPLPIDDKEILGVHQSFNASTKRMLTDFHDSQAETCLIMEGDCIFKDLGRLEGALSELPDDWDLVYLGANIREGQPEQFSGSLFRIRNAWTTHAIGYHRRMIPYLLENQPGFSEEMYDNWLSTILPSFKAYIVSPMVAWQRPHYSGIWGREVNYDDIFRESQAKLN